MCVRCIHAHMAFLASDALRGRGSATPDELVAATYIASQLEQYGLEPGVEGGAYLQRATIVSRKLTGPPKLEIRLPKSGSTATKLNWTHGKEMLLLHMASPEFSGRLQKITPQQQSHIRPGAVVYAPAAKQEDLEQFLSVLVAHGAAAIILPQPESVRAQWKSQASRLPKLPTRVEDTRQEGLGLKVDVIAVTKTAAAALDQVPDGAVIRLNSSAGKPQKSFTWNVVAKIPGTEGAEQHSAVLLTAHFDHLGVGPAVNGDQIYNGADDDASGTTAVLELARVLASRPNRRPVVIALFGSEEKGGLGSSYFRDHPPIPLQDIAAYLEFEMIGRADPAVASDTLWLTGWERSNLGPELASHGAHLVGDPHPEQNFFERSDNYVFAKTGMVAQTVSSYGLHKDYHRPSDEVSRIDFKHMDEAIGSLIEPLLWLVNSSFVPKWNAGGRP